MSKLSELDAVSPLTGGALLLVTDGDGNSRKVTAADLAQWIKTAESIVPASEPFRGARVKRSATLAITATTDTTISWEAVDFDTDDIFSSGAPTRLTVPAGVTKVRVELSLACQSAGSAINWLIGIRLNGTAIAEQQMASGFNDHKAMVSSGPVDVTGGDYFDARTYMSAGKTIAADARVWFAMHILEVQP